MNTLEKPSYVVAGKESSRCRCYLRHCAGNSNQTQVNPGDLDYNNYWNGSPGVALTECTHTEFGYTAYNTLNRRGCHNNWCTGTGANTIYPAINIGALDDQIQSGGTAVMLATDQQIIKKKLLVIVTEVLVLIVMLHR